MEDRTRFVDQEVLQAIAQGIAQVIILGSGYDGRCLRFRKQGMWDGETWIFQSR
jgi:O-methyltransferase involved in polyketide biosynthesis